MTWTESGETERKWKYRHKRKLPLHCDSFFKLAIGLEPTTYSLRMSCTTNCATQAYIQTKEELISSLYDQSGNRTRVCAVRGRRLSRLTNWPKKSRWQDSNLRPQRPERCTPPNWATPREKSSRGRGARTPIYGFGDRCSTIELFPSARYFDTISVKL